MPKICTTLLFALTLTLSGTPAISQQMVKDLLTGPDSGNPHDFVEFQGSLYFFSDSPLGYAMWRYHPNAGTDIVRLFGTNKTAGNPIVYQNRIYFEEGTRNFTNPRIHWDRQISSYHPSTGIVKVVDSRFSTSIVHNDTLYFQGAAPNHHDNQWSLYRYHPTTGIEPILIPGQYDPSYWSDFYVEEFISYKGDLYFTGGLGDTFNYTEFYRYNASIGKVEHIINFDNFYEGHVISNDSLYLHLGGGLGSSIETENLWRYHPTAGLKKVVHQSSRYIGYGCQCGDNIAVLDGIIYFNAYDSLHGYELWSYGPVSGKNQLVADIYPGKEGSRPSGLITYNGRIYFRAYNSLYGHELWSYDPSTGAQLVKDINPNKVLSRYYPDGGSRPTGFTIYKGSLFFAANDGKHGRELWAYNSYPITCAYCNPDDWEFEAESDQDDSGFRRARSKYLYDVDGATLAGFTMSAKSGEGETLWEEEMEMSGELELPYLDDPATKLAFTRHSEEVSQTLLELDPQLAQAGVSYLQVASDPAENRLSLQINTLEEQGLLVHFALQSAEGEVVYQEVLEAPWEGELEELPELANHTVVLSVAGENYRTSSYTKESASLSAEVLPTDGSLSSSLQVYPNPVVNHILHLNVVGEEASPISVQVLNLMGQTVLQRELATRMGQQQLTVDMQGIPKGAYILKVQQGQQQSTTRLLVVE
ncbi:T9SS type A sorting domain-containing protein [Tunicatimonas pelagia]|uniref:T9SS type A sorting domain-containing protein n=1 Tax=Tunicatimonas pelagia TaxID=931531 RepID=UPI002665BC9A|nr:T9SS type A sorting domain-containing protein [Tunicatimonas pelagia]WKN41637.1 T9SS type A sorting domain-containing protein [Tunicatimonas pelagia]